MFRPHPASLRSVRRQTPTREVGLLTAAFIGIVAVATLSGCSGSSNSTQQAAASPSSTASSPAASASASRQPSVDPSPQVQDVFTLAIGDCVNGTSEGEVSDVPTVDCAAPHDLEVFYEFDLSGDAYPGDSAVSDAAKAGCQAQFASFVGIAYADSALDFTEYTPTQDSWSSGDRSVSCVVGDPNGKTTGTLAGAAR